MVQAQADYFWGRADAPRPLLRRDLAGGEMTLSAVDFVFTALALALAAESWLTFAGAR